MVTILLVLVAGMAGAGGLTVETQHGPVQGEVRSQLDPRLGREVAWTQFSNIPYAAPPTGALRFRPPAPPPAWTTPPPPAADQNLTICPQLGGPGQLYGRSDEDCLYLHVAVPRVSPARVSPAHVSGLAVMVWIHGGGFMTGDGTPDSFGPGYWMAHGVIIVTINYRLGPLGYLSLGTEEVAGNMGQLDQVAALRWVQANIAQFGGDPDQVTIFGQSAGAAAVTYHLFSEQTRGLFR